MSASLPERFPAWGGASLASTLRFLAVPAAVVLALRTLGIEIPVPALYAVAAGLGIALFVRTLTDPEWLLAVAVLYLPLDRLYVVPIVPGINGTNVVLILLVFAWWREARREGRSMFAPRPGTKLMGWWAVLSLLSVVTAMFFVNPSYIIEDNLERVKGWSDQFVVFFAVINLIRDGKMARRVAIYLMLGTLLGSLLGFQEWFDKRDYESIEKARLLGPQLQPNDFGAFLVYGMGPPLGLFVSFYRDLRAWAVFVPWFGMIVRVLLATFSRGAFMGAGLLGVMVLFARGRILFACAAFAAFAIVNGAPEWLPSALTDRMAQTGDEDRLDSSSETRLVLWKAAMQISAEHPLLGTGFATFPHFKDEYTEVPVPESDNHNMYLYIASQMGLPALGVFLALFIRMFALGWTVRAHAPDRFAQGIGLGCVGLVAGVLGVCMFGSRMVDLNVMAYVWLYLAVISHLYLEVCATAHNDSKP